MKTIKKIILFSVLGIVMAILLVLGLRAYIERETQVFIYDSVTEVPTAKTVIILGASVFSDGKLSNILKDRVDTAFRLYKEGKVENFLVTGDHRSDDYNEVKAMRNYLIYRGVPSEKIILDHSGLDTYDSMYRAGSVFEIEEAIVVTQKFHLPRAIFIAKHLKLPYTGLAAHSKSYRTTNKIERRELFANFKAVYELVSKSKPESLEK